MTDLRYAMRTLVRNKGFAAAAMATLAIGIGANTAVFSVVDAVLIKNLPVERPAELVLFSWLRTQDSMVARYSGYGRPGPAPGVGIRTSFSYRTFERFRDHTRTLSDVFAFAPLNNVNVAADRQADSASGQLVTGHYFAALGIPALRGRTLVPSDDHVDATPVAVISHRYWQRRFAGDPQIVGRTIEVDRTRIDIVGVTPEGFDGIRASQTTDITFPLAMAARIDPAATGRSASVWWVEIMGRLEPGATREHALADLQRVYEESVRESWASRPADTPNQTRASIPALAVMAGGQGPDGPRRDAVQIVAPLVAIVGAILLIGCVNVANLLLARAASRRHEVAVRFALGASRARIVRHLFTESALLAIGGGIAGAVVAFWAKDFLSWLPVPDAPVVAAEIDRRVLAFTAGLSAMTTVLFGLGPALRTTRTDLGPSMRISAQKGGVARGLMHRGLIVAQVATCLVLLVGAGLFLRTLHSFSKVDVGFDADNLLVFRINPAPRAGSEASLFQLYEDVIAAIEALPGTRSATASALPVLAHSEWSESVTADGGRDSHDAYVQSVRWNFFDTMGLPLLAGRGLSSSDRERAARVAVINETMARQIFSDPNAVGRQFQFVTGRDRNVGIEVVGLVRDSKYARLEQAAPPTLYLPHTQVPPGAMTFAVRTATDPIALAPAIRQALQRIDPGLTPFDMKTQRQQIAETIGLPRSLALVTSVFAAIGLLLASIGLYGIVAFDVTRRTSEIGLRIALGARERHVLRLVLRETMIVVLIGAAVGVGLALAASRLVARFLYGIDSTDPVTMTLAVLVLTAVAALAGYLPARRASRLDPTQALRHE